MRTGHGPAGPDAPASHLCFCPDMRRGAIIKHTRSPVPSLACSPRSLAVRGRCMAVATARRPPSPPQHVLGGAGQDTPRTLPTRPAQHAHPPPLVRPVRTWACAQPEGARPVIVSRVSRRIVASPHRFSAGAAHSPPGAWGPCMWPPVCSCGMPRPHRRGPWPAGRVPGKSCFGAHGGSQRDRRLAVGSALRRLGERPPGWRAARGAEPAAADCRRSAAACSVAAQRRTTYRGREPGLEVFVLVGDPQYWDCHRPCFDDRQYRRKRGRQKAPEVKSQFAMREFALESIMASRTERLEDFERIKDWQSQASRAHLPKWVEPASLDAGVCHGGAARWIRTES